MISQHRFTDAEEQLRALIDGGDRDASLLHNLGLALYFQHRFEEARQCFAAAAEGGLEVPSNFAYLARSLHHLGEIELAIAAGERWLATASGGESTSYLALLHLDAGNMQTASRLGIEALEQDATNVDANVVVGSTSMEHQDADRARKCFEIALQRDQDNGRAWLGMGLVHLYDQEPQQAVQALTAATQIYPGNAGMAVTLGWAHIVANDAIGAEHAFNNALAVDHTFAESHAGLAAALALQGKLDRARESLVIARRLERHSIGADIAESFLRSAEGEEQQAADIFAHMLKKSPRKGVPPLIEQLRLYSSKKGALRKGGSALKGQPDS